MTRRTTGPTRQPDKPRQKKKKAAFLVALAELGLVREACHAAGISHGTIYAWRARSEAFAEEFEAARAKGEQILADSLEAALLKRAREGWDKPVWYKGQQVGSEKWFSDVAAIFLLKGLRPHKYMEQLVGVNIAGQAVTVRIQTFAAPLAAPAAALQPTALALSSGDAGTVFPTTKANGSGDPS